MKRFIKYFSLVVILISFFACSKEEDEFDVVEPTSSDTSLIKDEPSIYAYLLNEGTWGYNNSSVDAIFTDGSVSLNYFETINNKKVGDVGNDLIATNNCVYISVFGSNYISKLNKNLEVVQTYSFSEEEGSPRNLCISGSNLYVTTYGGYVAKFDTADISKAQFLSVGPRPEEITSVNGNLYIVIAGDYNVAYDNRIAVVDLTTYQVVNYIEVLEDPTNVVNIDNTLYIVHYNTELWTQEILQVSLNDNTFSILHAGAKLAVYNNQLYFVDTFTDWNTLEVTSKFYTYVNGEIKEFYLSGVDLSESTIYLFKFSKNGNIVIGTTDYKSNGDIYIFSSEGVLNQHFQSSGVNPSKVVFFE